MNFYANSTKWLLCTKNLETAGFKEFHLQIQKIIRFSQKSLQEFKA